MAEKPGIVADDEHGKSFRGPRVDQMRPGEHEAEVGDIRCAGWTMCKHGSRIPAKNAREIKPFVADGLERIFKVAAEVIDPSGRVESEGSTPG
jgi:hypothetical protein